VGTADARVARRVIAEQNPDRICSRGLVNFACAIDLDRHDGRE
jgi:hypothetical protein